MSESRTEMDILAEGIITRVLRDHREDALTCYDHPSEPESRVWCCVCGEHSLTIPWRWHVAHAIWRALPPAPTQDRGTGEAGQ